VKITKAVKRLEASIEALVEAVSVEFVGLPAEPVRFEFALPSPVDKGSSPVAVLFVPSAGGAVVELKQRVFVGGVSSVDLPGAGTVEVVKRVSKESVIVDDRVLAEPGDLVPTEQAGDLPLEATVKGSRSQSWGDCRIEAGPTGPRVKANRGRSCAMKVTGNLDSFKYWLELQVEGPGSCFVGVPVLVSKTETVAYVGKRLSRPFVPSPVPTTFPTTTTTTATTTIAGALPAVQAAPAVPVEATPTFTGPGFGFYPEGEQTWNALDLSPCSSNGSLEFKTYVNENSKTLVVRW
jgi:hypothetical protein